MVWLSKRFVSLNPLIVFFAVHVCGLIESIEIDGKQFVNSRTKEPFYIKGVDYQPGDSSNVNYESDPLTDPDICARDILLFQELGINTIRIYSVNPDLNHDKCMSMLASAGLYLILDVNSPLPNQHLNRYEPWTSYNSHYLEHVFKVVEQFSHYNNTLGFFAGNEVVNDKRSAQHSPPYIKALVRDIKSYLKEHSPRMVPVGYSAADDLAYRVPLSCYLECTEDSTTDMSVDFYGVNSYQWCGKQTLETSGYDVLVEAYKNYTKPVFFSEFGCNKVLPRTFEEIEALYSKEMYTTFSGGLVYEYSQENNNYGLVELDDNGNAYILEDFHSLQGQYEKLELPSRAEVEGAIIEDPAISEVDKDHSPYCKQKYENLDIKARVTKGLSKSLVKEGVLVKKGEFVELNDEDMLTSFEIFDTDGSDWKNNKKIEKVIDISYPKSKHEEHQNSPKKSSAKPFKLSLKSLLLSFLLNFIFS